MAVPSSTTVGNLTRCKTLPGFFPGGYCDQFIRKVPFEAVEAYGPTLAINRATLGGASNYGAAGTPDGTASASATTSFTFRRIGGTAEADEADFVATPEAQDLLVQMKRVSVIRQLAQQVIQGNDTGAELAGLRILTDAGQAILPAAGVGAPVIDDYYRLIDKVCASDGTSGVGPDALLVHPRTRRQMLGLLDATGGPEYSFDEALGVPVLLFCGLPVYVSQNMFTDESGGGTPGGGTYTSAYALKLHGPTGLRILHQGGDPADYGIVIDDVPTQLSVSARASTVRGYYSVLLPELGSIARMTGIDITAYP